MNDNNNNIDRRTFLRYAGSLAAFAGASAVLPSYALAGFGSEKREVLTPKGPDNVIDLTIGRIPKMIDGKEGGAIGINGTVPGPVVRLQEGEDVLIRVTNKLEEETSIHWHGILLPFQMDGVPGVSFDGITPGATFEYRYPVRQNGTYWYHSHSGLQEQLGHYGPLIIDPAGEDPVEYDREYPVILSDWTFEDPHEVLENLVKMDGYYNFQQRTLGEFFKDAGEKGLGDTIKNYLSFGKMRMSATDLLDVTGATYTFLMNGRGPDSNWNALFKKGEKVRLRFINASAGTTAFDVRIPGLDMTVVQADGQNVQPTPIEEFRIGIAETYDVIVEPKEEKAYTIFAESLDRSGYARGTLTPREGMSAPVPEQRPRPQRSMRDMGMMMQMGGMDMEGDSMKMDHEKMNHGNRPMPAMKETPVKHKPGGHGIGSAAIAEYQFNRLDEPGIGLGNDDRKVLAYNDLKKLTPNTDVRPAQREIELHLTGNMERYMWSFDGKQFHEVDGPIEFKHNERLRLILVNDTMMEHPIHLHGMWMELENGNGPYNPRKHTLLVQPAQRISALITPRDKGRWAFHCHILYHMERGMFRVVQVEDESGSIYGQDYS